jgi:hypothetical protein
MKTSHTMPVVAACALAILIAAPAGARTHRHATHRAAPCAKVREALASGKTVDQVAKSMKMTTAAVEHCQDQAKSGKAAR